MLCLNSDCNSEEFDLEFELLYSFSDAEIEFLSKAEELLENILDSQDFRIRFYNLNPTQTKGMNQREIYNKLRDSVLEHPIRIGLKTYPSAKTMGSTMMRSGKIFVNKIWYKRFMAMAQGMGIAFLASHLSHELMHRLGFVHKRTWFGRLDRRSLPYETGYLVKRIAIEVINGKELTIIHGL
jgi:hypothetical protein